MPDPTYIATALAVAVTITVALRALPFAMKSALNESALLADIGRWMPLGAITILAIYCLAGIDLTTPSHGVPEIAGVAATIAIHLWRRNAVLSIVTGTAACLVLTNLALPA
ncbi:branched-chain amino acid transporter permease [Kribbella sp. CA-245084]|uniref:branched-chain amino acid transporter permease n=1 Tax=Kribbella sp. CA-245084 TaxID=3239940 RepID=UPI003D8EA53E